MVLEVTKATARGMGIVEHILKQDGMRLMDN